MYRRPTESNGANSILLTSAMKIAAVRPEIKRLATTSAIFPPGGAPAEHEVRRPEETDSRERVSTSQGRVRSVGTRSKSQARRIRVWPVGPNIMEMVAKTLKCMTALSLGDGLLELGERDMNDVVMVKLFSGEPFARIQPNFVKQVDFLGR